jgi:hypothetical protein
VLVRRLTPVLAAGVLAGLAASGCASQAVGIRVGDRTYSESDLVAELDAYGEVASGQASTGVQGELADSYSQSFAGVILEQRIGFMLAEELFDESGLELTDEVREATRDQLTNEVPEFSEFPDDYREQFLDDVTRYNLLASQLGPDEFNQALLDEASATDIEVNSQFGEWDEDDFAIVPPPGATPAPGSDSRAGQQGPAGQTPGAPAG